MCSTIFGNNTADSLITPPIASGSIENGRDVFQYCFDPERFGQLATKEQAVVGGIGLRHEQPEDPLLTQGARAECRHYTAIDAAGDPDHNPLALELHAYCVSDPCGDTFGFR